MFTKSAHFFLATALVVSLGACSSTPKPKTEMALSGSALQGAEVAGAREFAPIELRKAREKQDHADAAIANEDFFKAKRLSQQAAVDADLAKAKTDAERSRIALKEVQDSIKLMRHEINRAQSQ